MLLGVAFSSSCGVIGGLQTHIGPYLALSAIDFVHWRLYNRTRRTLEFSLNQRKSLT